MFGFKLNETLGRWAFWFWNIGFYVCFMPQYLLGLMGMTRRISTFDWDTGWGPLNVVSTMGAYLMGVAFLFQVLQIAYSIKHREVDTTGDIWDAHTLEWSIPSPAPEYNFAVVPVVDSRDPLWVEKQRRAAGKLPKNPPKPVYAPIHMPKNSSIPIIMSTFFFIAGFGFVFLWTWMAVLGLIGVAGCMIARSFQYDTDYYIPVEEIEKTEASIRGTV